MRQTPTLSLSLTRVWCSLIFFVVVEEQYRLEEKKKEFFTRENADSDYYRLLRFYAA